MSIVVSSLALRKMNVIPFFQEIYCLSNIIFTKKVYKIPKTTEYVPVKKSIMFYS